MSAQSGVTLTLRTSCCFDCKIGFSPPSDALFASFVPNTIAEDLIDRADRALRKVPADRC